MELEGKKLSDFKVVELRNELEKRGLDTKGVKGVLVDRLTQVNTSIIKAFNIKY